MRRVAMTTLALALAAATSASFSAAEVAQKGHLRVSFDGKVSPHSLPRAGVAPVAVTVGGRIATTNRSDPPALRKIEIAINRAGRLDYQGLPVCRLEDIQPATTENALAACAASKVGEGTFSASVAIPEQSPFPSEGKVVAFSGAERGKPVIFAHVYGTDPVPTSYTLPLKITKSKGTFATVLAASLPEVTANVAFVTGLSLTLGRRYRSHGKAHSYLSAGCPAPKGFPGASFPLLRASFGFAGGKALSAILRRSCGVR